MPVNRFTARKLLVSSLKVVRLNRVAGRLYYRYLHGFASAGRHLPDVVKQCLEKSALEGWLANADYHEFGVFKGHTLLHAQRVIAAMGCSDGSHCFGYDSFQGLPDPRGIDLRGGQPFHAGQYKSLREEVEANLDDHGFDWSRGTLVEGYFDRTLTPELKAAQRMGRAAVVLVDCDLYESSRQALEFVADLVAEGSILILDDFEAYGSSEELGQKRAFYEFSAERPDLEFKEISTYEPYGRVFQGFSRRRDVGES